MIFRVIEVKFLDFCQKLQRSQEKSDSEDGEKGSGDGSGSLLPRKQKTEDNTDFVKHPFALKPVGPITINITVRQIPKIAHFMFLFFY